MALTPYTLHNFVDDSEPDINALHLNEIDQGIKDAIDGVNGILNALSSQVEDNPAKFASSAALYAVNGTLNTVSTNLGALQGTVSTLNSNLTAHKTSSDHDGRYYTKAQIDAFLDQMAVMYYVNNNVVIADAKTKKIYQTTNLQTNKLITDANGWVNTYDLTTVKVP